MADLKFGKNQFNMPTPQWMKNLFNFVLYVTGLWAILAPMLTNLAAELIHSIDHWALVTLAVMRFTIQFFHYDYTEDK